MSNASAEFRGERHLLYDAAFATAIGTLNSGVVLVAYALMLGAPASVSACWRRCRS